MDVTIFDYLMANDETFRKAVTSKAALYGMTLYQSASQIASGAAIENPLPKSPSKRTKTRSKPKRRRKQNGLRLKGNDLAQAKKDNAIIKQGIMRVLSRGRATTDQIRKGLSSKSAATLKNRQHMTNNLSHLLNQGQVRKVPGTKTPHTQWEAVPGK
jgi:hypothetical protein